MPGSFGDISQTNAIFRKYLNKNATHDMLCCATIPPPSKKKKENEEKLIKFLLGHDCSKCKLPFLTS